MIAPAVEVCRYCATRRSATARSLPPAQVGRTSALIWGTQSRLHCRPSMYATRSFITTGCRHCPKDEALLQCSFSQTTNGTSGPMSSESRIFYISSNSSVTNRPASLALNLDGMKTSKTLWSPNRRGLATRRPPTALGIGNKYE